MNEAASLERRLLGLLLAAVLVLAWIDSLSTTAAAFRSHRSWSAWLSLRSATGASAPPTLFLMTYSPDRRTLHFVRMPETSASRKAYHAGRDNGLAQYFDDELGTGTYSLLRWSAAPEGLHSAEALKSWIAARPMGLRYLLTLPGILQRLRHSGNALPGTYDLLVLARELFRLETFRIRPEELPAERDLPALVAQLEGGAAPALSGPIPVAVLNASGEAGVATQATKVLRWRGLDVVDFGNASSPSTSTHLIDHASSDVEADAVGRLLGCGELDVTDALDAGRRERLTIVLGRDFRRCSVLSGLSTMP